MRSPSPASFRGLEDKVFLLLIVAVSMAFAWIIRPLYGAVLWGVVIAIVFAPLYRRLHGALRQKRNLAALAAVMIIVVMVILPLTIIATMLLKEASVVYQRIQSGELSFGRYFQQVFDSVPAWASGLLERFGLTDLSALRERISTGLTQGSQALISQAVTVGQNTFNFFVNLFVMLYLLFFLLRDGEELSRRAANAIPLRAEHKHALFNKFAVVIRATVKGNMVVALLQGALGGLIFWILGIQGVLLWAVLMAMFSLVPAVGAAVVWLPVAIYLLATGALWRGGILLAFGVLVISLVDNVVRPILVGKDTKMPDYVVLISTLGGLAVFGPNGFVIGPVVAAMFIAVWDIFAASAAGKSAELHETR